MLFVVVVVGDVSRFGNTYTQTHILTPNTSLSLSLLSLSLSLLLLLLFTDSLTDPHDEFKPVGQYGQDEKILWPWNIFCDPNETLVQCFDEEPIVVTYEIITYFTIIFNYLILFFMY